MKYYALILLFFTSIIGNATPPGFFKYENALFNYQVIYPKFLQHHPKHLGDNTQVFSGKNGKITVQATFSEDLKEKANTAAIIVKNAYQLKLNELKSQKLTIDKSIALENSYVIQASDGKDVTYYKTILLAPCGVQLLMTVNFSKQDESLWTPILEEVSQGFKYSSERCQGNYQNFLH